MSYQVIVTWHDKDYTWETTKDEKQMKEQVEQLKRYPFFSSIRVRYINEEV